MQKKYKDILALCALRWQGAVYLSLCYRHGNKSWTEVQLRWNYGVNGLIEIDETAFGYGAKE